MSGGLALFWHDNIHVDIKDFGPRFIDAHIWLGAGEPLFHVTFVYGEPRVENRHRMWALLSALRATSSLPWIVLGDFNEALWQYEHFSACRRPESQTT
jgi:endonuclease/exonuclease/phosphatase family metal-dependent hydrolase